jgi:hypothetical protein
VRKMRRDSAGRIDHFCQDRVVTCAFQNQIKTSPKYIAMQKVKLEQSWRDTQAKTLPEAESIHWGEQTVSPIAIYRLVPPRCRVCVGVGVRGGGGSGRVSAAAPVRPSCAGLSLSRLALVTLTWPPDQPRGLVLFPPRHTLLASGCVCETLNKCDGVRAFVVPKLTAPATTQRSCNPAVSGQVEASECPRVA